MPERRHLPSPVSLIRRRPKPRRGRQLLVDEPTAEQPHRSGLIDSAVYRHGERQCTPSTLADTFSALRDEPDGMAWIGLYRPDAEELKTLAREFDLHELAVEDAITAHQRPKLERYGDTLFVVLRAARYLDEAEEVEFGELHIFLGKDFVVTVRHAESPDLSLVRHRLEDDPDLLGPRHRSGALRDPRRSRRRLRAGRRRHRERRRRDRDAGLRRRSRRVAAHLRAVPRGHRLPARRLPARRDARRAGGRIRQVRRGRGVAPRACATSPTTSPR